MSDKQNWSAWLSEQLEACGDSIDADAFDAIVAELNRRPDPAPVGVGEEVVEHIDRLERIGNELRQKCKSKGVDCEICDNQRKAIKAAQDALRANPQPGAVVGDYDISRKAREVRVSRAGACTAGQIESLSAIDLSEEVIEAAYQAWRERAASGHSTNRECVAAALRTLTNTDKGVV